LASGFAYAFGFAGNAASFAAPHRDGIFHRALVLADADFAAENLQRRLEDIRFLIGAVGLGAILGTFALAARGSVRGLGRVIAAATVAAGVALTGFSWSGTLWLSLVFLAIFGAGLVVTAASINTILQTIADEDKRARVISMYVMCFLGLRPSATSPRVRSPRRSELTGLYSDAASSWSRRRRVRPGSEELGASGEAGVPQAGNHPGTAGVGCGRKADQQSSAIVSS